MLFPVLDWWEGFCVFAPLLPLCLVICGQCGVRDRPSIMVYFWTHVAYCDVISVRHFCCCPFLMIYIVALLLPCVGFISDGLIQLLDC